MDEQEIMSGVEAKVEFKEGVREKEIDVLRRQIFLIQMSTDPTMLIARIEMFEGLMSEYLEKSTTSYNPIQLETDSRKRFGVKPGAGVPNEVLYMLALEKFKRLYMIFKEHHLPVSVEAKI